MSKYYWDLSHPGICVTSAEWEHLWLNRLKDWGMQWAQQRSWSLWKKLQSWPESSWTLYTGDNSRSNFSLTNSTNHPFHWVCVFFFCSNAHPALLCWSVEFLEAFIWLSFLFKLITSTAYQAYPRCLWAVSPLSSWLFRSCFNLTVYNFSFLKLSVLWLY